MLLGRFFFGLGAETSIVVVSKIIVKWFKGKELAMAFGFKIGIARAGSWAAFYFSPVIASKCIFMECCHLVCSNVAGYWITCFPGLYDV